MFGDLMILSGNAHPALADNICAHLGIHRLQTEVKKFSNDNIFVRLKQSVRAKDVYIVQPFAQPVSDNIMELLIMIDTCKRSSAGRVTAVVPYYAYARTDKKDQPRVPITARLIADLITVAGADRVITVDLHAGQIQGFFSIPMDELTALHLQARYFASLGLTDVVVVSPDLGAAKRARDLAREIGVRFAVINKRRDPLTGEVEALDIIGDVREKKAIILDDEIDTGGSVQAAADALNKGGAKEIYVCCTHAIFSGDAVKNLTSTPFKQIVICDTLPVSEATAKALGNLRVLSVAPLLGDVIRCINEGKSVGKMLGELME